MPEYDASVYDPTNFDNYDPCLYTDGVVIRQSDCPCHLCRDELDGLGE